MVRTTIPVSPNRPLICLVTDRRRLCSAVGRPVDDWRSLLECQMAGAVAGGVDLIQFREPDLEAGDILDYLRTAGPRVPGLMSRLVVNDRLDVALAAGAAGVHLRESSVPASEVRAVAPRDFLAGRSVHGSSPSESYHDASYVIAGSVFTSDSKPAGQVPLGLDGLRAIIRRAGAVPVIAIGGLRDESVRDLMAAGGAGFAAIGWFIPDLAARLDEFVQKRVSDLRFAFDSSPSST